jgi:hypothetical protein
LKIATGFLVPYTGTGPRRSSAACRLTRGQVFRHPCRLSRFDEQSSGAQWPGRWPRSKFDPATPQPGSRRRFGRHKAVLSATCISDAGQQRRDRPRRYPDSFISSYASRWSLSRDDAAGRFEPAPTPSPYLATALQTGHKPEPLRQSGPR